MVIRQSWNDVMVFVVIVVSEEGGGERMAKERDGVGDE
jgi:hypothetical protein